MLKYFVRVQNDFTMNNALISELKQNTRLRIGVWLIVAILAGYGLLLMDEQRQSLRQDHAAKLEHFARLQGVVSQTQWTERMQQLNQMKLLFEENFWRANTKGLAEADVQNWLNERTQLVKLKNASVNVENAVDMPKLPNLWMVSAEVRALFTPESFQHFLYTLYFNKWLVIERVSASNRGANSRFTLALRIYFQKPK